MITYNLEEETKRSNGEKIWPSNRKGLGKEIGSSWEFYLVLGFGKKERKKRELGLWLLMLCLGVKWGL